MASHPREIRDRMLLAQEQDEPERRVRTTGEREATPQRTEYRPTQRPVRRREPIYDEDPEDGEYEDERRPPPILMRREEDTFINERRAPKAPIMRRRELSPEERYEYEQELAYAEGRDVRRRNGRQPEPPQKKRSLFGRLKNRDIANEYDDRVREAPKGRNKKQIVTGLLAILFAAAGALLGAYGYVAGDSQINAIASIRFLHLSNVAMFLAIICLLFSITFSNTGKS